MGMAAVRVKQRPLKLRWRRRQLWQQEAPRAGHAQRRRPRRPRAAGTGLPAQRQRRQVVLQHCLLLEGPLQRRVQPPLRRLGRRRGSRGLRRQELQLPQHPRCCRAGAQALQQRTARAPSGAANVGGFAAGEEEGAAAAAAPRSLLAARGTKAAAVGLSAPLLPMRSMVACAGPRKSSSSCYSKTQKP